MSQIGKKEILIPEKVSVNIESSLITAKGPLGELSLNFKDGIKEADNYNLITSQIDSFLVSFNYSRLESKMNFYNQKEIMKLIKKYKNNIFVLKKT